MYELLRAIEYYANRDRNPEYSEGYALGRIEGLLQEPLRILRASLGRAALEPILSLVELESYIAERAIKCQPLSLSTERTTNE